MFSGNDIENTLPHFNVFSEGVAEVKEFDMLGFQTNAPSNGGELVC